MQVFENVFLSLNFSFVFTPYFNSSCFFNFVCQHDSWCPLFWALWMAPSRFGGFLSLCSDRNYDFWWPHTHRTTVWTLDRYSHTFPRFFVVHISILLLPFHFFTRPPSFYLLYFVIATLLKGCSCMRPRNSEIWMIKMISWEGMHC